MSSGVSLFLAGIHAGYGFQSNSVDEEKTVEQRTVRPQQRKFSLAISANHLPRC